MKKILSGIISSFIAASMSIGMIASAETAQEPNFSMNGNKCGKVIVRAEIESDVHVTITQHTEEGDFDYYESVIPSDANDGVYSFILEGKDDASYTVKIGVSKYKNSSSSASLQYYEDEFVVHDTDEIKTQDVSGYEYKYTVYEGDELKSEKTVENKKNSSNIIQNEVNVYFPMSDALPGDSNLDGVVNIRDAANIARMVAQNKASQLPETSDYNGDGKVNVRDAAAIAKDASQKNK